MNHVTSSAPRRILFDCSHTFRTDVNTGIQRVVRNLARGVPAVAQQQRVIFQPVIRSKKDLYGVSLRPRHWIAPSALKKIYRQSLSPLARNLPDSKLRKALLPDPGHRGIFRLPTWALQQCEDFAHRTLWGPDSPFEGQKIDVGSHDTLILAELCAFHQDRELLHHFQARGAQVGALIYDLIPWSHPQFCDPRLVAQFRPWMKLMCETCDFFVSISETTQQELQTFARSQTTRRRPAEYRVFTLGADFCQRKSPAVRVRESVRSFFSVPQQPTFLTVGTIEPRKNHAMLLDAFELLWRQGCNVRLCIAGRVNALCHDVAQRITTSPEFGRRLASFHDLSDEELGFCYQQAHAVLTASVAEGFGLPIIEALEHGCRVVASGIPAHREVGKNSCKYFDLNDLHSLTRMVQELAQTSKQSREAGQVPLHTVDWQTSSRQFLDACLAMPTHLAAA